MSLRPGYEPPDGLEPELNLEAQGKRAGGTDRLIATLAAMPAEDREAYWIKHVFRKESRQLTVRAAVVGAVVGGVMSVANLYAGLKTGFTFGATFTAGILAFALFKTFERVLPGGEFTDLENNAMQSVASAAGFMASAGLVTAIPALVLMNQPALPAWKLGLWLIGVSLIGFLVAVPLKRQMINVEQLPFPSGTAAAEMIKSLHGEGESAMRRARWLGIGGVLGGLIAYVRDGHDAFMTKASASMPALKHLVTGLPSTWVTPFPSVRGIPAEKLTLGVDVSFLLYAAGAIVGLRTAASLMLGAAINWLVIAPWLIENKIEVNHKVIIGGFGKVVGWSAWPASGLLLAAALTATALQWRAFVGAFNQVNQLMRGTAPLGDGRLKEIEVPGSWVVGGLVAASILSVFLQAWIFDIPPLLGTLAVVTAMVLSVVVARATGETDISPPVTKLSQVGNALLTQGHPIVNLMTAGVTTGATIHASDLLTDLKSGYLLGARPRPQFFAQLIGIVIGSLFAAPAFALLVPNDKVLGEKFAAPGAFTSKATAEAMSQGFGAVAPSALHLMYYTLVLGVVLTLLEVFFPKARRFIPSPIGLGLGMLQPFSAALAIFVGALLAWGFQLANPKAAERYTIAFASGLITGESLMAVVVVALMLYFNIG